VYNINVVCAYGGGSLYEQCKACEDGAEIIVATPVSVIEPPCSNVNDQTCSIESPCRIVRLAKRESEVILAMLVSVY